MIQILSEDMSQKQIYKRILVSKTGVNVVHSTAEIDKTSDVFIIEESALNGPLTLEMDHLL